MKAYLFIEGETRLAKQGEWYMTSRGEIYYVEGSTTRGERNVLTRHEIEIPEKFTEIKIIAGSLCDLNAVVRIFPIPRPKKVKKWFWLVEDKSYCNAGYYNANGVLRTEEEIKQTFPNAKWYHRIDETMIEVPE